MSSLSHILRTTIFASALLLLYRSALAQDDQLTPSGPITNFAIPLYNDDGYRIWYLKGAKGIYENSNQVKIEGLQIRQHAGDETDAVISTAHSPAATFRRDEATAYGPGRLTVQNDTFTLAGDDWIWAAREDRITLNKKVEVTLFDSMGQTDAQSSGLTATKIESERVLLERNGDKAKFIFSGNVFLKNANLDLDSDQLEIYASQSSQEGAIQRILAVGNVHIKQNGRLTTAGKAEVLPLEEKIFLTVSPRIEQDGLSIDGGDSLVIDRREQSALFTGSPTNKVEAIGPALKNFSGGPSTNQANEIETPSTQIESVEVLVSQNEKGDAQFTFLKEVVLNATNLGLYTDKLEAFATQLQETEDLFGKEGAFQRIVATGNVHIAQAERTADADLAEILPTKEQIILSGNPRLQQTDTVVDGGETLIIDRSKERVEFLGSPDNQVHAVTSSISDLGFTVVPAEEAEPETEEETETSNTAKKEVEDPSPTDSNNETEGPVVAASEEKEAPPEPKIILSNATRESTRIDSNNLYVTNSGSQTVFRAIGDTVLLATNLKLVCDELEAFVAPQNSLKADEKAFGGVQRILAKGNLDIKQEQLTAIADQAEVLPLEEKIILTGNPHGENLATGAIYEGSKIIFDRKNGQLLIEDLSTEGTLPETEKENPTPQSSENAGTPSSEVKTDVPKKPEPDLSKDKPEAKEPNAKSESKPSRLSRDPRKR